MSINKKEISQQKNKDIEVFDYQKYIRPGIIKEEIINLKKMFDIFDTDKSGSLEPKELIEAFANSDYKIDPKVIYQIIAQLDKDDTGNISFDELYNFVYSKNNRKQTVKEQAQQLFNCFDIDLGGTVTILELRRISKELGYNKSEQELQDMFKKVDKDRDGLLKVQDFIDILNFKP